MIKFNLSQSIKALYLAGLIILTISSSAYSAEYVSVVKDGVNVRTGPSTDKPVYMELFKGYPLKVLEKKGDWLKITDFEKDTGWIHSSLTKTGNTVIVSASDKVNMRSGPGTKNPGIANIAKGVVLEVVTRKGNWVKLKHLSGTNGWIYGPLLWP